MAASQLGDIIFQLIDDDILHCEIVNGKKYGDSELLSGFRKCNSQEETYLVFAMKLKKVDLVAAMLNRVIKCSEIEEFRSLCSTLITEVIDSSLTIIEKMDYLIGTLKSLPRSNQDTHCYFIGVNLNQVLVMHNILPDGTYFLRDTLRNLSCWLDFISDCILSSSIPREEKIFALELTGTSFIFNKLMRERRNPKEETAFSLGILCWKKALALRNLNDESIHDPTQACTKDCEFMTFEQLDQLEDQPSSDTKCEKQPEFSILRTLLFTCRNSSQFDPLQQAGPYLLHLQNLLKYCDYFYYKGQEDVVLNIGFLILHQFNGSFSKPCSMAIDVCYNTLQMVARLNRVTWQMCNYRENLSVSKSDFLEVARLHIMVTNLMLLHPVTRENLDKLTRVTGTMYKFAVAMIDRYPRSRYCPHLNLEEKEQLKECIFQYIHQLNSVSSVDTLLHISITELFKGRPERRDDRLKLIELFLDLGADPNAVDKHGQTPLHILARRADRIASTDKWSFPVFQLLLDEGADILQPTSTGETLRSILKEVQHEESYYVELLPVPSMMPLTHLCARVICRNKIPFRDRLPSSLHIMVQYRGRQTRKDKTQLVIRQR